jgi:RNA polymerase sigma factor (sigma-70 family)
MIDDRELLRRYADDASEEAFAAIVQRHTPIVYSAALRQLCGHDALARDVTQSVFVALANQRHRAKTIMHLPAWLYATTRFTVSHVVRAERRRQMRETEAQVLGTAAAAVTLNDPAELPQQVLDEALTALPEADRAAVLLRFFSGLSFKEIAGTLRTSEDSARMRVSRALDKLRQHFARQGIHSSVGLVGSALAAQAATVPAGLASHIVTAALVAAKVAAPSSVLLTLMSSKSIACLATAAAIFAGGFSLYQLAENRATTVLAAQTGSELGALRTAFDHERQRSAELTRQVAHATVEQNALRAQLTALAGEKNRADRPGTVTPARPQPATNALAEWKAKLAAGTPITGAMVGLIGGKPTPVPVQFVMGKETEFATDEGTYHVTPQLRDDGAVRYKLELWDKEGKTRLWLPAIIAKPWGGFTAGSGAGAIGFDPDIPRPAGEPE